MMRILMAISLLALVLACARKDAGKGLNKFSVRNPGPERETANREDAEFLFDSTFYIGYVDYFPETKEFYTALFFKEGYEYPDEEILESKLDSVIVLEDDWGRERLPMDEARRFLVLSGLDTLSIYNRRHDLICRAPLTRVEYLWNGLESYFVAVFRSDGKYDEQKEELYGISSAYSPSKKSSFSDREIEDGNLNNFLSKKLNINRTVNWDMRHYRISPPERIFSIISSYTLTSDKGLSYLTSLENNEVRILNEEKDSFHFLNILPVPIELNGKPLLLISAGYPSSDVLWDYLAAFDGAAYQAMDYNRIHSRMLMNNP